MYVRHVVTFPTTNAGITHATANGTHRLSAATAATVPVHTVAMTASSTHTRRRTCGSRTGDWW